MSKGRPEPPLTSTSVVPAILAVVSVQFANGVSSLLGLICKPTSFDSTSAACSESVHRGEDERRARMNRNIKAAAKRQTELVTPKETPSMKKWLENWRQRQHCNFCRHRFRVQEGSELALFPTSWSPDQWHVGCTTTDHMRPPETAGKRVLLISHDRELRRQLHSCLSTAGIATTALTTVRNGNECLAAL